MPQVSVLLGRVVMNMTYKGDFCYCCAAAPKFACVQDCWEGLERRLTHELLA